MALRNKIYQSEYPYHIYNRANNKEYLFDLDICFPIFMDCLKTIAQRTDFRPHHFILMNNHYHLIGSTPKANLNEFMHAFQTTVSQVINKTTSRVNHVFGGRYGSTVITSEGYLASVIRYLYQNPIRANLTKDIFSYAYSTFYAYLNSTWRNMGFFIDPYLKNIPSECLAEKLKELCLSNISEQTNSFLRKCLKKKIF